MGSFLRGFGVGARVVIVVGECGTVPGVVSWFSASKALAFLDAFFSFFLGELFNVDGVDIHDIWINFWALMIGVIPLNRVWVVGFLGSNDICSVPLGFEVDGTSVPFIDFGGHSVHAIDSFHEGSRDSS